MYVCVYYISRVFCIYQDLSNAILNNWPILAYLSVYLSYGKILKPLSSIFFYFIWLNAYEFIASTH